MWMTNLNKIRQLPRKERRRLIQSVLFLPLIHLALLSLGYYRLKGWMERSSPLHDIYSSALESERLQRAREVARIVYIAAEHGIYKATCLRRSLLVWWFLRREGIPSDIRFGVRMQDRKLEAHAWVECHGVVVNDSAAVQENYQALEGVFPSTQLGL
jgi:hypothetical protein